MNLEDNLGDILRKARAMNGAVVGSVAKAAGLTESELPALEASGTASKNISFPALAQSLGLHPGKLEGIAKGWLPAAKDLGVWRELRQISTTEEGNQVHCYLIWDEVTREAAAF